MVDSIANPGGGERLAIENAVRLDGERFERWICFTRWHPDFLVEEPGAALISHLKDAGVHVVGLRRRGRLDFAAWRPLVHLLKSHHFDVLHGHLFGSNVWAVAIGKLARVPLIVAHEHMWSYGDNPLRAVIDREFIARFSDAFIAVSEAGRDEMIEKEGIDPSDIVLIRNGIEGFEVPDGSAIRSKLDIPEDALVIGSVGHLRPEKAFETLIAATAALMPEFPDLHLVIAGEGSERAALEADIDRLGLQGHVHLIGSRSDVQQLLGAFDLAVCCSDFEGGPLSVMEYMEAALPVVATKVGGLPELIVEPTNGLLVAARDPLALKDAIAKLLRDPELRASMGQKGREMRQQRWDLTKWAKDLERLYTDRLSVPSSLR